MSTKEEEQPVELSVLQVPYFANKPAFFCDAADMVIVLDNSDRLPVHSDYLTAHSTVLGDIISTDGERRKKGKPELPLPDTTNQEACHFLSLLYDFDRQKLISADTLPSILKIAHKFDMAEVLSSCDERMANLASFDGKSKIKLWVRVFLARPHSLMVQHTCNDKSFHSSSYVIVLISKQGQAVIHGGVD